MEEQHKGGVGGGGQWQLHGPSICWELWCRLTAVWLARQDKYEPASTDFSELIYVET